MNTKKQKILLIILVTLLIMTISVITLKILDSKNSKLEFLVEELVVDNCYSQKCKSEVGEETIYPILSINYKNKNLQNELSKINATTRELYNQSLQSTIDTEECNDYKYDYKHSEISGKIGRLYQGEDYISVLLIYEKRNVCNNTKEEIENSLIYSAKNKKILTQDEIKSMYNITDKKIQELIKEDIDRINAIDDPEMKCDYENTFKENKQKTILYFEPDGTLAIMYYHYDLNTYTMFTLAN